MSTIAILVVIDLLGLGAIWLYVRSRINRALGLDSLLSGIRKEVGILTTELNETTDRNISLVEDRMEALRGLLDEADRRMGVVRRELDTRAAENEVYSRLGRPRPLPVPVPASPQAAAPAGAGPVKPEPSLPGFDPAPAYLEAGRDGGEARPQGGTASRGDGPIRLDLPHKAVEIVQARESVIPARSLREQALELYSRGFSSDIIAARLGTTVAEMDLLISLEEERRQTEGH